MSDFEISYNKETGMWEGKAESCINLGIVIKEDFERLKAAVELYNQVVRCGECKHYESGRCNNYHGLYGRPKKDDFCSYGEMKDDDCG